jgi:hypothetical protein
MILQSPSDHITTALSICYRCAINLRSLSNHFAVGLQSHSKRFQALCDCFTIVTLLSQPLRNRFAIRSHSLCSCVLVALKLRGERFANALQTVCDRFQVVSLQLCYRCAITLQSLFIALRSVCNRFAIASQSLCKRFVICLQALCGRFAIAFNRFTVGLRALCKRFAIDLQPLQLFASAANRLTLALLSLC